MSVRSDMLNEISVAIGGLPSSYLVQPARDYDIFEGYIFALLLEEARNVRANVQCTDNMGNMSPPVCMFRTSPGYITSNDQYTYALISFPGRRKATLEAHVGIFVTNKASSSPGKLLIDQGKRLSWQPRIYPNPLDDTDVSRLRGLFKDFFKNYMES